MQTTIRKLKQEDIVKASEVFYLSFNSVGEKWTREICEKRLQQYFNPDSCWVAEYENKIVGVLTSKEDNVTDHQELYIDIIAVDPTCHKSGIGTKLAQTAEEYAKSKGYKAMWLSASTDLQSFNWYMKTGFKETSWKALVKEF